MASDDDGALLEVIQGQCAAWAQNDADAMTAYYAKDATVVQPREYKKNRDEIRAMMAAAFAGPLKGSRITDDTKSIWFIGEDAAVVISEVGILMAGETELPSERLVRVSWTLAKQEDGKWLIAAFHSSPAS